MRVTLWRTEYYYYYYYNYSMYVFDGCKPLANAIASPTPAFAAPTPAYWLNRLQASYNITVPKLTYDLLAAQYLDTSSCACCFFVCVLRALYVCDACTRTLESVCVLSTHAA